MRSILDGPNIGMISIQINLLKPESAYFEIKGESSSRWVKVTINLLMP